MIARIVLLAVLVLGASLLSTRDASANAAMVAAAQSADAGVAACGGSAGKALYDCLANAIDSLANSIPGKDVGSTRGALHAAAAKLRAATSKAQALSAVTQCRALILSALAKVRAIGGGHVAGWGGGEGAGAGLEAVANVLSHAARLIQSKG
jgi:hypothetical protein